MAILQTGSSRLGQIQRAPVIDESAFDVDIEALGRAATMPGRVKETVEDLSERTAERGIRNATRPARKKVAVALAEGKANQIGDEVTVMNRQAQGAANRVDREQTMADRTLDRSLNTFDTETDQIQADRLAKIARDRANAESEAQRLKILEKTERDNIMAGRQRAANTLTGEQINAVQGSTNLAVAEGTPGTQTTTLADGSEIMESFVTTPTGERRLLQDPESKSARQVQAEEQKLRIEQQRALAYAKQVETTTGRKANVRTFKNVDMFGNTLSITTVVTDAQSGQQLDMRTVPFADGQPAQATPAPAGSEMLETEEDFSMQTEDLVAPTSAPANNLPTRQTAPAGPPITENGQQFVPTGEPRNGYTRGVVYNHPTLGRILYTGGDPFDPNNYEMMQ